MMTDFHLTSSIFGLLLFILTIGTLIGSTLTYYWTEKLSINGNILAGKCIAIFGMVLFVIIFYFFPSPIVFMINIAFFMISVPLISTTVTMQVMSINQTLAGSALAFLSVGFNALNTASGAFVSRQDGEVMGVIMLVVLVIGFAIHSLLSRKVSH